MILVQDPLTGWYTDFFNSTAILTNVHNHRLCEGRGCAIHNHPSAHALADAPLNWRTDSGKLERICEHGIGHDDYDSVLYLQSAHPEWTHVGSHGCDGCCWTPIDNN